MEIKPKYVVHGDDWTTGIQKNVRKNVIDILQEWSGELIEVPYTEGVSSTNIKEKIGNKITTEDRRKSLRNIHPLGRLILDTQISTTRLY